jgi:hypothetical protein
MVLVTVTRVGTGYQYHNQDRWLVDDSEVIGGDRSSQHIANKDNWRTPIHR